MTETVGSAATSSREPEADEPDDVRSVTELVEQLGRELGALALCEAQLETSRNMPEVRRAARDLVGALLVAVALLTAFAFVNVAAVGGLASAMPVWASALVLAAVWLAVGGSLLLAFMARARRWRLWSVFTAGSTVAVEELEHARDEAVAAVRVTVEHLGPAIAVEITSAAVPMAGDIASSVVDAGGDLLEASDDIVEALAEGLPAGSVVNQLWDFALMPGRFGVRVVTTVLRRETPTG